MSGYVSVEDIRVHRTLYDAVNNEILPGTGISHDQFWSSMSSLIYKFGPTNAALLRKRDSIQAQIDEYHLRNFGKKHDAVDYAAFLASIGYLVKQGADFKVDTSNVDEEIACTPGAQLVVPIDNARYAINAANARWGSLLDAFYGTNAGPDMKQWPSGKGGEYSEERGSKVFEYAHKFLDTYFKLSNNGSFNNVTKFSINNGGSLVLTMKNGNECRLQNNETQFVGYNGNDLNNLTEILLRNNGLHVIILIDKNSKIGKTHAAGVKDILLESAVSTIADCEDSVAAVDAYDKTNVYLNWNGLMKGNLESTFMKNGKNMTRRLNKDKVFKSANGGKTVVLPGRAMLLVRNVSIHMYTDAILTKNNQETPEGFMDLMITTLAALHDIKKKGKGQNNDGIQNSRKGSMYIVKPKLHGPEEVSFVIKTFEFVENVFGLSPNTLKIGIMDEERRTTVNLFECIREAKYRCIFINTGFLDRTGDEIHTSFHAGSVLIKSDIKQAQWRIAYENYNVEVGLAVGLMKHGQIGKGMWAAPNEMSKMLSTKGEHPQSGATCAWVPSPTAATLHAIHYHETNVLKIQELMLNNKEKKTINQLRSEILLPPIIGLAGQGPASVNGYDNNTVIKEVENNAQGILGYVVRWVELGVGCSTVPDMNDIGLMEDRATLRISSQHIANWLYHGVVSKKDVINIFEKMAQIVDKQNLANKKQASGYKEMYNNFDTNNAYKCALELVMNGKESNNGLTEYILTKYRRQEKALLNSKQSKL